MLHGDLAFWLVTFFQESIIILRLATYIKKNCYGMPSANGVSMSLKVTTEARWVQVLYDLHSLKRTNQIFIYLFIYLFFIYTGLKSAQHESCFPLMPRCTTKTIQYHKHVTNSNLKIGLGLVFILAAQAVAMADSYSHSCSRPLQRKQHHQP